MTPSLQEVVETKLSKLDAQKIVDALRTGTVPSQHLELLSVGREFWLNAIKEDMELIGQGASKIRFIAGDWGGGKTFFFNLVRTEGLSRNFVVSYVDLHSKEAPMDKFEVIFPKVMRGMEISGCSTGLEAIFDHWIDNFELYDRRQIEAKLREISPSMDFRAALRSYLEFSGLDSPESREHLATILGWMGGNKLPSIFARKTGILNQISVGNVNEVFGSFLRFIRHIGFNGLILLLDEAESVTSLAKSERRDEANQNIRKLFDNADNHLGFYILFATTPKFLNDPNVGARSYGALWSRMKDVLDLNMKYPNKRALVIPLKELDRNDLLKLGNTIVLIHGLSYGWNASERFTKDCTLKYVGQFLTKSHEKLARTFIRGLITFLDIMEQNESIDPLSEIGNIQFANE